MLMPLRLPENDDPFSFPVSVPISIPISVPISVSIPGSRPVQILNPILPFRLERPLTIGRSGLKHERAGKQQGQGYGA